MGGKSRWDYLKAIYVRYQKVSKRLRAQILDEFCQVCDYNRKYAIRLLNGPAPQRPKTIVRKGRRPAYVWLEGLPRNQTTHSPEVRKNIEELIKGGFEYLRR